MTLNSVLCCVVLVALLSAFMILLAKKLGIIEWMQVHGSDVVSQLASCDFCLSFWTGTILSIVVAFIAGDVRCLIFGLASCSLTRLLVV